MQDSLNNAIGESKGGDHLIAVLDAMSLEIHNDKMKKVGLPTAESLEELPSDARVALLYLSSRTLRDTLSDFTMLMEFLLDVK